MNTASKSTLAFSILVRFVLCATVAITAGGAYAQAPTRPNFLVIFSDDVGHWNISAYSRG